MKKSKEVEKSRENQPPFKEVGPLTKYDVVKILTKMAVETPEEEAAIEAAIQSVLACPNCLGVGVFWSDIKPGGPHKVKRSVNGVLKYSRKCPTCSGTGTFTEVVCTSCNVKENLLCNSKNTFHCLKCYETLDRKGYL